MRYEKTGIQIGKKFIAWTSGKSLLATKPVNVNETIVTQTPKLKNDIVQISKNSSCIPNNLTNMADISNEFMKIDKSLMKANSLEDFQNIAIDINRLANSAERNILMQRFQARYKVFKSPFNGVKNGFSQIFGRELSNQEVVQLCQNYKNIFSEQDNLKFLGKLYSQIMQDFGINPNKLQFRLCNTHTSDVASVTKESDILRLYVGNGACLSDPENRIKAMNAIFHELTHLRQNMIAYGTSPDAYIEAIARNALKKGHYQGKNLEEVKGIVKTSIQHGVLVDSPRINLNSEMGQKGLRYINGNLNYKESSDGQLQYIEQLIEKEAFEAGHMAEQAIRFILAGLL